MDPRKISITDYTYALPDEKIARHPLPQRDASRLLIYQNGKIEEDSYRHIDRHIPAGSVLVFNNTKVIEARLLFQKPTGGMIEIFCLEPSPVYADVTSAMLQKKSVQWQCLIGGASKWKHGQVLQKHITGKPNDLLLEARFIAKQKDDFLIELSWTPENISFAEVLHVAGAIPLPPYLKRDAEKEDEERYQTVYARNDGSVAAPTAGLHFTAETLQHLSAKGISQEFVTLHVGAGTFKPVSAETLEQHDMHQEFITVPLSVIENILRQHNNKIVAVGTTSLRTLETLYWLGVKLMQYPELDPGQLFISQWEAYELPQNIAVADALPALIKWMKNHRMATLHSHTQMIITPGYTIRMVDALITNFHQPQSTLLLLVAAVAGESWKKIYDYALAHDFRFLSYGDGSLLWLQK